MASTPTRDLSLTKMKERVHKLVLRCSPQAEQEFHEMWYIMSLSMPSLQAIVGFDRRSLHIQFSQSLLGCISNVALSR